MKNKNLQETENDKAEYVCELVKKDSNKTITFQAYIYFNAGYQLKVKNVITYIYNNLTDEEYIELLKKVAPLVCNNLKSPAKNELNHIKTGITTVGWDTTIDRDGNKVVLQGYTLQGQGESLSDIEKKDIINSFVSQGYKCK